MAEELMVNSDEIKGFDKNSINESVKILYQFIIDFLDYFNVLHGKVHINSKSSKETKKRNSKNAEDANIGSEIKIKDEEL